LCLRQINIIGGSVKVAYFPYSIFFNNTSPSAGSSYSQNKEGGVKEEQGIVSGM
jgi:hypothetical protein